MVVITVNGRLPAGTSRRLVEKLASTAFRVAGGRGKAALSVNVVSDAAIRTLNRRYRGKDAVTDVLSFGADDGSFAVAERVEGHDLGDLFIAMPRVARQARETGRPVREEFALMVVHGTLHLMGYDHETLAQEKRMFGLQHEILIRAGIL